MASRGDYVLLLPEDAPGLTEPSYGKVTALNGATATVTGVPNAITRWSVPTEIAGQRITTATDAQGPQPGRWLRQPVAAHLSPGWVHGQVVGVEATQVRVRHGDTVSACPLKRLLKTDPIVALLLGDAVLSTRFRAPKLRQIHSQMLDKLLDTTNRQLKPSWDMQVILADIIPNTEVPAPDTERVWVEASTGREMHFPLQHAVDYVYVSESNARRIPKAIRESIGVSFCCPPSTGPYGRVASPSGSGRLSPDSFFDVDKANVESVEEMTRQDMEPHAPPSLQPPHDAYHAQIVRALAPQPELLMAYLSSIDLPEESSRKRQRTDAPQIPDERDTTSKHAFRPTTHQVAIHELLVSRNEAGTSADVFIDSLISHFAIQFAPHPGVLIRLYDFQFGIRGLSIMHFTFMDTVGKMLWIKSRKANMQNFSHAVALPEPTAPASREEITAALDSLQTYCATFMAPEASDLVRCLHAFVQQEITSVWSAEDLQHFVFWIDGVLESFREAAVRDLRSGGASRRAIQATIVRSNPDFQATVQLLTQRQLQELLRSGVTQQPSRSLHCTSGNTSADTGRRRQDPARFREVTRDSPNYLQHVPRQRKLELCLRSLSRSGCAGVPSDPSQCIYPNRCHFTPPALHDDVRTYINQRLGGLSSDFLHL